MSSNKVVEIIKDGDGLTFGYIIDRAGMIKILKTLLASKPYEFWLDKDLIGKIYDAIIPEKADIPVRFNVEEMATAVMAIKKYNLSFDDVVKYIKQGEMLIQLAKIYIQTDEYKEIMIKTQASVDNEFNTTGNSPKISLH